MHLRKILALALGVLAATAAHAGSLRFFGNGVNDIDRVKIRIDDPANSNPGPPADVGSTDFTIEFLLRSESDANPAPAIACGANIDWIYGNIVFDRDRYNQSRSFGISLGAGRVVFGTNTSAQRTICGTSDVRDGAWHHVAVQRRFADGQLSIYVDGELEQTGDTPNNEDISYPDDGVPGNFCGGPCTNTDPFIVLGAEKHDAGAAYPSFDGWLDELRISNVLRYSGTFTPPQSAFVADANTAALYHFDETTGTDVLDSASGGASDGVLRVGGNPSGPLRSTETPFGGSAAGVIEFDASAYVAGEGELAATGTVVRASGSVGPVSVEYSTVAGTASAGSDFTAVLGTLSWGDGDAAAKAIAVPLNNDAVFEGDESFTLLLHDVTGGAAIGSRASAVVTIQDNDPAPVPGVLALTASAFNIIESNSVATITARRTGGADGSVSVAYATASGTAAAGADYQHVSGVLTWGNGDAADKTFAIAIIDDAVAESDETLSILLNNAAGGASLGTPLMANLTIADDDQPPGTPPGGNLVPIIDLLLLDEEP